MMRNLKVLGVSLALIFTVSAVAGSAASADQLTSDGPVKLSTNKSEATLSAFGTNTTCDVEYLVGLENETPHTFFDPSIIFVAIFTVAPYYTNCEAAGLPATAVMNGCDYLVHVGNGVEHWEVVCPESAQIELRVYSGPAHSFLVCTVKVPEQSGISGGSLGNIEEEGIEKITLGGTLEGIEATKSGLCGSQSGSAEMAVHSIVSGENESGKPTGVKVD